MGFWSSVGSMFGGGNRDTYGSDPVSAADPLTTREDMINAEGQSRINARKGVENDYTRPPLNIDDATRSDRNFDDPSDSGVHHSSGDGRVHGYITPSAPSPQNTVQSRVIILDGNTVHGHDGPDTFLVVGGVNRIVGFDPLGGDKIVFKANDGGVKMTNSYAGHFIDASGAPVKIESGNTSVVFWGGPEPKVAALALLNDPYVVKGEHGIEGAFGDGWVNII